MMHTCQTSRGDRGSRAILIGLGCCWALAASSAGGASLWGAEPGAAPAVQPPVAPGTAKPAAPVRPATEPATKPPAPPAAKKGKEGEAKKPPPQPKIVVLETDEPNGRWSIYCTYYAPQEGVRDGKVTPPIILLHGWGGQGSEYNFLAAGLQMFGFAVMVPDLRGHGRSTSRKKLDGTVETVKFDDLKPMDIEGMIRDVETVKRYLRSRHNQGELNIDMLCVVGAEVGSIIAMNWAVLDWSVSATTWGKQGQDVKALVLLSPEMNFKKLNAAEALKTLVIGRQLSILIAAGQNDRDATKIHKQLESLRPKVPKDREERLKKDLFLVTEDTPLQGTNLLNRQLHVNRAILDFLMLRLVQKAGDYPWTERVNPLTGKPYGIDRSP